MAFPRYSSKTVYHRIVFALIFLICAVQFAIPLSYAQAALIVVPVGEAPLAASHVSNTTTNTSHTVEDYAVNYILKPALRVILAGLVQSLINQTVAWITGDEGRNVGFVKDFEQEVLNQANGRGGEFLNRLAGVNLCSANLRNYLKLGLSTPNGNPNFLHAQFSCSLTGIVDNVDNFYKSFENGGWAAFLAIAANPQNNPYGATMMAQINFNAAQGSALSSLEQKLKDSGGFKGVTLKKKSEVCDVNPETGEPICYTKEVSTTPGKIVSEALSKSLNDTAFDFLSADTANIAENAVNTIMTALVQRLMKEAKNLF